MGGGIKKNKKIKIKNKKIVDKCEFCFINSSFPDQAGSRARG